MSTASEWIRYRGEMGHAELSLDGYAGYYGCMDRGDEDCGKIRAKGIASNEMCTFLILNISSLQLIPVSIIAYRSQYGSANAAAIVGPAILATAVSTGVAVVFCRLMDRKC